MFTTVESTTADYIIDWGDETSDKASGTGNKTYNHTYATIGNYQVEIRNCANISKCNGTPECLIAYWSIGNSKVSDLSFQEFKKLSYVGLVFKNDRNRKNIINCFERCYSLANIHIGLFDNCTEVITFYRCFEYCESLVSIPTELFKNCPKVSSFNGCFYNCNSLTAIPVGLFNSCTE